MFDASAIIEESQVIIEYYNCNILFVKMVGL